GPRLPGKRGPRPFDATRVGCSLRRGRRPGRCADAVQGVFRADEELAVRGRRRGADRLAEGVPAHLLEAVTRLQDVDDAVLVGEVEETTGDDRRGVVLAPQPLLPESLAGAGLEAAGDALVVDEEEPAAERRRRGDVAGAPGVAPQDV